MRKSPSTFITRLAGILATGLLLFSYPLGAIALAEAGSTGPQSPTGAEAPSYTYNESTGLWENDYYTWDPVTKQTAPKSPTTYSYNPTTGMWDNTEWVWDAPSQKYVPNTISTTAEAPAGASVNSIENTGPDSDNTITNTQDNTGTFDMFYNASISNTSNSTARTGNATISGNTTGGSATSGDASGIENIINLLQSNWDPQAAMPLLFNADINGNVTGDLILDPNIINTTGPGSTATIDSQKDNNLTINYDANGTITNDLTVEAISGDATVSGNTEGGNASSGDARVVANIVNMINSAIAAGNSFVGNININGNFNGDILLPPNFIDQLISSSGPNSTVDITKTVNNNIVANFDNTHTITNITDLNAQSGAATVDGNTTGGSATTGNANTNLTILNLTGTNTISANTLLVFVNVLGQWIGMLVNAPGGSNSVAYCGGDCEITSVENNNVDLDVTTNFAITNNLDLDASTGNALVSGNTKGGNAASGNASASANIANILGSQFLASDWFGILFINVNGFWNGSFGINTSAGYIAPVAGAAAGAESPAVAKVFQFVPGPGVESKFTLTPLLGGSNSSGSTPNAGQPQIAAAGIQSIRDAVAANKSVKKGGVPAWVLPVIAASVTLAIFTLGAASELYDKIWAARITRAAGKNKKLRKSWFAGLRWKLPLF